MNLSEMSPPTVTDYGNGIKKLSYSSIGSGNSAELTIGQTSVTGTNIDVGIDITSDSAASFLDDGSDIPKPLSARTSFLLGIKVPSMSRQVEPDPPYIFDAVIQLASTSKLLLDGLNGQFPSASEWNYKSGFMGMIRSPSLAATGPFDAANPPPVTLIGSDCPTSVSPTPVNCATNAVIDVSKIHVTASSVWDDYVADGRFYVQSGNYFPTPFRPTGIMITVDPDAVTYTKPFSPAVKWKFIQNLETFTGYSVYQDGAGTSRSEWVAVIAPTGTNSLVLAAPLVDYTSKSLPYYDDQTGVLKDSPEIHAPLKDPQGRSLSAMHYTKTFTAYFGCHTDKDLSDYPITTDSTRYLHPLAEISWGVNYFGKVSLCLISCRFDPDTSTGATNTRSGPGVFFEAPKPLSDETLHASPVVVPPASNGNTNYICLSGNGVCA